MTALLKNISIKSLIHTSLHAHFFPFEELMFKFDSFLFLFFFFITAVLRARI